MEIYLLNDRAERIAILSEYESLVWRTSLTTSRAELKAPLDRFLDVSKATYLERSDSDTILFINAKRMQGHSEDLSNNGCYLSAYDPVELLRRRVLFRTHYFNHSRAEIIRRLVAAATATVSLLPERDRAIPLFTPLAITSIGEHLNQTLEKQASWGDIYSRIESVLESLPVRFYSQRFTGHSAGITPLIYEGRDLTGEVRLTTEDGDLTDVVYSFESIDRPNMAIVGGQGEGAQRRVTSASIPLEVPYGELWVDANDISNYDENQNPLPAARVTSYLQERGIDRLHEQPCEHALYASVSQDRFQYGTDYSVGDRIGFSAFGASHDDIVSEVEEVFEGGHPKVNITIGTAYPTIRQIVERIRT